MGLLNPSALIFSLLLAVLVLLYLWERFRRRVEVPSLLLWRAVHEDQVQAQKFRPDLLFILQLLLLLALIGGLARPYLRRGRSESAAERHIFVLDTSASMQAREGQKTRFEAARAEVDRRIDALPAGDEVMLMTAAARPEIVADFTRDHATARAAVQRLEPTDTGTNLELALAVATGARRRADGDADVQVFSDLPPSQLSRGWQDGAGEMSFAQFGETDANLAITGLQIHQSRFQEPRAARAYVLVQNFSHRDGHGVLTVTLDDESVSRTGFTIPPRDARAFLVSGFSGAGRVAARLDGADALAADDRALAWIRPLIPTRVLLVSWLTPLVSELERVARATPGLQLRSVRPEQYDETASAGADVVIFHRVVPEAMPPVAAMYVDPPADNSLFPVREVVRGVEVLDWNDHHPAVGSLRPLASLPIQHAKVIAAAEGQQPLLISRTAEGEFPLAFAGEIGGRRVACIGFDLESERLLSSDSVNFLMFFLNLLSWLAPDVAQVATVATGSVVSLADLPPAPLTAVDPHGRPIALLGDGTRSLETLAAGEYHIRADGVARTVYANLFDPVESDIGRAGKEPDVPRKAASGAPTSAPARTPRGREFGWWLYAAAAGLLVTEWMVAMWRR